MRRHYTQRAGETHTRRDAHTYTHTATHTHTHTHTQRGREGQREGGRETERAAEHLRQGMWNTWPQGRRLARATAGVISSLQMMHTPSQRARSSSVASAKRSSMFAVTRRYRKKSATRFRKFRNVQYRSLTCNEPPKTPICKKSATGFRKLRNVQNKFLTYRASPTH
jgi:hypothetical protein